MGKNEQQPGKDEPDPRFAGDKDMPLFSRTEGEAAIAYLDVAIDLANARKAGLTKVDIEGKTMSFTDAARIVRDRYAAFLSVVKEETQRTGGGEADNQRVKMRARDILQCHADTGYIPPAPGRG